MRSASLIGNRLHQGSLSTAVKAVGASRFEFSIKCWVQGRVDPLLWHRLLCFMARQPPLQPPSGGGGASAPALMRFLDHTKRRTTVGRTPLDEWSARRKDLYLKTHTTHNRQTPMPPPPPVGFEPTISAGERPQTHALDSEDTGIGLLPMYIV
jgi:hypothetical protein